MNHPLGDGPNFGGANLRPQQQVKISLEQTEGVKCPCGCQIFAEGLLLRKVSRLLTGQTEDGVMPIPAHYCVKCQSPLIEMLPDEVQKMLGITEPSKIVT